MTRQRNLLVLVLLLAVSVAVAAQQNSGKLFPYPYKIDDLPNGLRLVTVPTEFPDLVALYIVVQAGSRNEVEPGKTGFAHLFEHLMFRGSANFTKEQRDAILKTAGAESNATTSNDRTVYFETFSKDDLDPVLKLEADRFQRLKYDESAFKTEALAVLGEYNKDSTDPSSRLSEALSATAFRKHTYSHTTIGYRADVENMPNEYAYSLEFYKRFYRPEYVTILMVGDVTPEHALDLTRKYFGDWKRGDYKPGIPLEPPQTEARSVKVDWSSPTLTSVVVAFHAPAYSDEDKEKAALDILGPLAFGQTSDLYNKLVRVEQKVDRINQSYGNSMDPGLFQVSAAVKDPKDAEYVRTQILETFARLSDETMAQSKLDDTRSRRRYGLALQLNSSSAIASALAPYIALRRTPETLNKLFDLYQQITPRDLRAAAEKYFTEANRTTAMLEYKPAK
jgi:zinc protease